MGIGELVDTGGQFICDDMPEVMALARPRRKTLLEAHFDGDYVAQPAMTPEDAERAYAGSGALRDRMNLISPDDPVIAGLSVGAWLRAQDETGGCEGRVPLDDRGPVVPWARRTAALASDRQRPAHHQRGRRTAIFARRDAALACRRSRRRSGRPDQAGDAGDVDRARRPRALRRMPAARSSKPMRRSSRFLR